MKRVKKIISIMLVFAILIQYFPVTAYAKTNTDSDSVKTEESTEAIQGEAGGRTAYQNMAYHFDKHVINEGQTFLGKNIVQYTNNAKSFYGANQGLIQWTSSGNNAIRGMYAGQKAGGFFSQSGKILSFFH